jgi:hypothetical protein
VPYWQVIHKAQVGSDGRKSSSEYVYEGKRDPYLAKDPTVPTVAALHKEALAQVRRELAVPVVFRPVATLEDSLTTNDRLDAYRRSSSRPCWSRWYKPARRRC